MLEWVALALKAWESSSGSSSAPECPRGQQWQEEAHPQMWMPQHLVIKYLRILRSTHFIFQVRVFCFSSPHSLFPGFERKLQTSWICCATFLKWAACMNERTKLVSLQFQAGQWVRPICFPHSILNYWEVSMTIHRYCSWEKERWTPEMHFQMRLPVIRAFQKFKGERIFRWTCVRLKKSHQIYETPVQN